MLSTTVYSAGWVPKIVPVQSTGNTEFLGGIYDTDNSGTSTLEWLKTKAEIAVQCIRSRKGFSAEAKIGVLNMSVLSSMVYKALNSVLSHPELRTIDHIIDNVLVTTTRNMFSFPRKLLHISKEFGGYGLLQFSAEAEARKLQRLFSCLRSKLSHGLAARGILSRAARQHGYFLSPGQRVVIIPGNVSRSRQKTYCDGPISYLAEHGLYLGRHGYTVHPEDLSFPLMDLIPSGDEHLRTECLNNGLHTVGDVTHVKDGQTT